MKLGKTAEEINDMEITPFEMLAPVDENTCQRVLNLARRKAARYVVRYDVLLFDSSKLGTRYFWPLASDTSRDDLVKAVTNTLSPRGLVSDMGTPTAWAKMPSDDDGWNELESKLSDNRKEE